MTVMTRAQIKRDRDEEKLKRAKKRRASRAPMISPIRRSNRGPPPLRHLSGHFESLFRDARDAKGPVSTLSVNGRHLVRLSCSPNVYAIKNFLTSSEIEHIRTITKTRFKASYTDDPSTKKRILSSERTSTFTFLRKFQDQIVRKIESRAAEIAGLSPANVEPLQIVSYRKGQHFDVHHDLGPYDESTGEVEFVRRPTRLVTLFVYMNTLPPDAGGHTEFPSIGLTCRPVEGTAILWGNVRQDSERRGCWVPDERTIHRGCPVSKGRKLGMNVWITDTNLIGAG